GALAMGLTMLTLYLNNIEAAPDQPWAMRRCVPVILPMLLVAAAAGLRSLWQLPRGALLTRPLVAAVFIYSISFPYSVSKPLKHLREEVPQLGQLQALCRAVGPDGAVMETDGAVLFGYGQSIRSFCDVPTIGLVSPT